MTRPPVAVRPAGPDERGTAAAILAQAFIDDPAMAWLFPDRTTRPLHLHRLFTLICGIDADPALWTLALDGGEPRAAALWRAPGQWRTPTSAMLWRLPALVRAFGLALPRALAMQARMEAHHPRAPHWYLQFAGCVPAAQGRGRGGAAIRAQLARCDADGLPAALETATPSNVGLYQALGFVVTDAFDIRNGPHFWAMWREPVV